MFTEGKYMEMFYAKMLEDSVGTINELLTEALAGDRGIDEVGTIFTTTMTQQMAIFRKVFFDYFVNVGYALIDIQDLWSAFLVEFADKILGETHLLEEDEPLFGCGGIECGC